MFTLVCQKGDVEGPALTLAVTASHEGQINQHRTSMFHRDNRSLKTKARRLEGLNGILKCHLESLTVVLLFFLRSKSSVFISLSLVRYLRFPLKISWPSYVQNCALLNACPIFGKRRVSPKRKSSICNSRVRVCTPVTFSGWV